MSNRVNSTAVYHAAGYTSFYNFLTQDLEELYTSDGLEFMVGDPDSYQDTPYVEITAPSGAEIISFYTPSVYLQSDVYRVNGVECPVVNLQNMQFDEGWAAGVPVTLYLINRKLWWPLGGGNLTELPEPDPILANNSWEMIIDTANKGKGQDYWNIGDKINIQVGDETLEFAIMDFNHDDKSDGTGKANITFGMTKRMANKHQINSTTTNVGSFIGSEMYTYLKDTVLLSMPQELQNVIKPVNKRTSAGDASTEIQVDSMSIWLFSAVEVGLSGDGYAASGEGTAYPYYTSLTRQKGDTWWLRSPYTGHSASFCVLTSSGALISYSAKSKCGVSFGFCI